MNLQRDERMLNLPDTQLLTELRDALTAQDGCYARISEDTIIVTSAHGVDIVKEVAHQHWPEQYVEFDAIGKFHTRLVFHPLTGKA